MSLAYPQQGPPPDQGQQVPPELAALLGGQQTPPGPSALGMPQDQPQQGGDPLSALQDAIHAAVGAQVALPNPQDTQDVAQAILILSKVQTRLMSGPPGAAQTG